MTETRRNDNPLEELHFALAEADAQLPPLGLGETVLDAALALRAAGRPVDEPSPISPIEAFRRAVASIDRLLTSLTPEEWHRPALRGLDVQQLVGHLTGVERDFQSGLRAGTDAPPDADHVTSTDPVAAAQRHRPSSETYAEWRAATAETEGGLDDAATAPAALGDVVTLHGLRMPLGPLLVVRTFELWTHEEDIRRATARPLQAPDLASLRLMTELAIAMLPAGMRSAQRPGNGRRARIVLTGTGGGTWQTKLGDDPHGPGPGDPGSDGPVDVRIVVDAVDFCRLVANRKDPAAIATVVTGDGALAEDLFAGAASLALD
jgi:uncharacterized protein (TIGR03083 family)